MKLAPRLEEVASYVRHNATLADVGTDHAYLPIYLILNNRIKNAVASDVVDGPLQKAREHIALYPHISDKIVTVKADGLCGIEKFTPTDITVCGMGGELIVKILQDAPFTKNRHINLVLQPMTHAEVLRIFLAENGYRIIKESIVAEGERVYQIILASYDGVVRALDLVSALLGEYNILNNGKGLDLLIIKHMNSLKKKIEGLKISGREASDDEELLAKLCQIYKEITNENS